MSSFRLPRQLPPLPAQPQTAVGRFQRVSQILRPLPGSVTQQAPQAAPQQTAYRGDHFQRQHPTSHLRTSAPRLRAPAELFQLTQVDAAPVSRPRSLPGFKQAGTQIAAVASRYGYARGQVIQDRQVIQAMLNKAGEIYGLPGDFLYRTAYRESGARHWNSNGQVRSSAAVGMMQIEKSAYPEATAGGPAQALNNVYDIGNNIAMGARNLRKNLDRLAQQTDYRGRQPWADLAPLLNISYNAGPGALRKAMDKARDMGLDPHNWQHLAFGRNLQMPSEGVFQAPAGSIESAPLHLALKEIHDSRAARGVHNYPIYWRDASNLRRHDFDQNGVTTRAERLISRIVYTQTGTTLRAR